jgi:hypothetical protein
VPGGSENRVGFHEYMLMSLADLLCFYLKVFVLSDKFVASCAIANYRHSSCLP